MSITDSTTNWLSAKRQPGIERHQAPTRRAVCTGPLALEPVSEIRLLESGGYLTQRAGNAYIWGVLTIAPRVRIEVSCDAPPALVQSV